MSEVEMKGSADRGHGLEDPWHEAGGLRHRSESLSSVLTRGIWRENPVFVHLMGLCPALAVTNSVINGLAMGLATTFVLVGSSILISLFRHFIPRAVRISSFVLIVGSFVTVADLFMQARAPTVSQALGPFVYLIVVNCMILGRHEAFTSKNPVGRSALDGLGTSLGFLVALVMMGAVREVLGAGSLLGIRVTPLRFEPWVVMALPPGGFFTIAFLLMGLNAAAGRGLNLGSASLRAQRHQYTRDGRDNS